MNKNPCTESPIFQIVKEAETGSPVPELCRKYCMSDASFYKWRARHGGMDVSSMTWLRALEEENRRLKKMYAESQLDREILREWRMTKRVLRLSRRKQMACQVVTDRRNRDQPRVWAVLDLGDVLSVLAQAVGRQPQDRRSVAAGNLCESR